MMAKFFKPLGIRVTLLAAALSGSPAFAQESTEEQAEGASAAQPASLPRVLYVDLPVPIEPGSDPVMPAPFGANDSSQSLEQDTQVTQESPEFDRRTQSISEYQQTIEAIEFDGGVWDQSLIEELSAIGRLQQLQGDHPAAIRTFDRAMQINRINDGLYTLQQVEDVELMIDSYLELGDWESADLYNNYLFYVQQKAYGANDPRLIPVLDRLGSWNVQAFNLGFGEVLGVRLSNAQLFFNAAARMVGMHFGRDDERFVPYMRNIARSAYLVSSNPHYINALQQPEHRLSQDALRNQLEETSPAVPVGYRAGLQALQEIVVAYSERDSIYDLAEAITNLADWNLMFNRRERAQQRYLEAWQMLAAEENADELHSQLFGQVAAIPTFSELPFNLALGSSSAKARNTLSFDTVDVQFAVTANGDPRGIEVLGEVPDAKRRQIGRIRRVIRDMSFRPVVEEGIPISTEGHRFRFRYWY